MTAPFMLEVPADHPAFDGHFPGQPLWPGVMLLAEALEAVLADPASAARLGSAPRLAQVKFLAPVRPGARLEIAIETGVDGLRFRLSQGEGVSATGQFHPGE